MNESLAGRWLRRYKLFFFLGLLILCGQLLLAYLLPIFGATDDILPNKNNNIANQNIHHVAVTSNHKDSRHLRQNNAGIVDDEDSNSNSYSKSKSSTKDLPVAVPSAVSPASSFDSMNAPKKYSLRLGELEFMPGCDIDTKEAVSAIHRAKTQHCKQTIANITCAIQAGTFYSSVLPNYCPNKNYIANRALGCFKDEKKFRILSGYYTNFKTLNTPAKCIQMCLQSGFLYAGVQYSSECFCGNTEPPATAKIADPECNYKCIGEPQQICGGYFAINIYETGISKFVPQTAELTPKNGDDKVRIAFLLTLNGRAVRQVHRLLKALYSRDHFYYIHVDARQDYMYRELLKLEKEADNIRLARKRFSTIWGGASLLTMLLASMEELLQLQWRWDFVINLSESDFLVKTTDKLVDFLTANKDRNFVKSHGREVQRFIQKQGLDKTFVECDTHMWRIGDRQLPNGIQIDGGSDWVALSRKFVEYITNDEKDELITGLLRIFHHTLLPAESFFHTAIRNSHFCNTYVDNNLHVTNWKRRLGCKCQYKHVVDWCGCSPNDFKPDDWPKLLATEAKQVFFARKFEPVINQAILLKLEEWLYGPHLDVPNLKSYWQSVYNSDDISPPRDEPLLMVAESIVGLKLASTVEHYAVGAYQLNAVKEVTTYIENDVYRGFLIHAAVVFDNLGPINVEVWTRHEQLPQSSRSIAVGKRITHLEVSTDFDQKEQISRNFAKILGMNSEPVIVLHLATSESTAPTMYNFTVLWINPAGRLVDVSDMNAEDSITGPSIHFSKSNLKPPLLPGIWTSKVIHKKGVIGKCEFMVCPSVGKIDAIDDLIVNDVYEGSAWNTYLPNKSDMAKMTENAVGNANLSGVELNQWIDRLVKRFFLIKDICAVQAVMTISTNSTLPFQICSHTNWSSMAPDPKSDIYSEFHRNHI